MKHWVILSIFLATDVLFRDFQVADAQAPETLPAPDPLTGTVQSTSSATGYLPDTGSNWFDRTHGYLEEHVGKPFIPGPSSPLAIYNKPEVLDPFYSKTHRFHHHHHFLIPVHRHVKHVHHHHHHHHHHQPIINHHLYHHESHHYPIHHFGGHHVSYPGNLVSVIHSNHHVHHAGTKHIIDSIDLPDTSKILTSEHHKPESSQASAIEINMDEDGNVKTVYHDNYHKSAHRNHAGTASHKQSHHRAGSLDFHVKLPTKYMPQHHTATNVLPVTTHPYVVDPSVADSIDVAQMHMIDNSHGDKLEGTTPQSNTVPPGPLVEQTGYGLPQQNLFTANQLPAPNILNHPAGENPYYQNPTAGYNAAGAGIGADGSIARNSGMAGQGAVSHGVTMQHDPYATIAPFITGDAAHSLPDSTPHVGADHETGSIQGASPLPIPVAEQAHEGSAPAVETYSHPLDASNDAIHGGQSLGPSAHGESFQAAPLPTTGTHDSVHLFGGQAESPSGFPHVTASSMDNTMYNILSSTGADGHHDNMDTTVVDHGKDIVENFHDTHYQTHEPAGHEMHAHDEVHVTDFDHSAGNVGNNDNMHDTVEHVLPATHTIHVSDDEHAGHVGEDVETSHESVSETHSEEEHVLPATHEIHVTDNEQLHHGNDALDHWNDGSHEVHVLDDSSEHEPSHSDDSPYAIHVSDNGHGYAVHTESFHDSDDGHGIVNQGLHHEHAIDDGGEIHVKAFHGPVVHHHMIQGDSHHVHADESIPAEEVHEHVLEHENVDESVVQNGHDHEEVHVGEMHSPFMHHEDVTEGIDHQLPENNEVHVEEFHEPDAHHDVTGLEHDEFNNEEVHDPGLHVNLHTLESRAEFHDGVGEAGDSHLAGHADVVDHHTGDSHSVRSGSADNYVLHTSYESTLGQLGDIHDAELHMGHYEHGAGHADHVEHVDHANHVQHEVHEVHNNEHEHGGIAPELHEANVHSNIDHEFHDGSHSESHDNVHTGHQATGHVDGIAPELKEANEHSNVVPQYHNDHSVSFKHHYPERGATATEHVYDEHGTEFIVGSNAHAKDDLHEAEAEAEAAPDNPHVNNRSEENNVEVDTKEEDLVKKARENEVVDPPFLTHSDPHGDGFGDGVVPGPDINIGPSSPGVPSPVTVTGPQIIPDGPPFVNNHPAIQMHGSVLGPDYGRKRGNPTPRAGGNFGGAVNLGDPKQPSEMKTTIHMTPKMPKTQVGSRRGNLSYVEVDKAVLHGTDTGNSTDLFHTIPNEPKALFKTLPNEQKAKETPQDSGMIVSVGDRNQQENNQTNGVPSNGSFEEQDQNKTETVEVNNSESFENANNATEPLNIENSNTTTTGDTQEMFGTNESDTNTTSDGKQQESSSFGNNDNRTESQNTGNNNTTTIRDTQAISGAEETGTNSTTSDGKQQESSGFGQNIGNNSTTTTGGTKEVLGTTESGTNSTNDDKQSLQENADSKNASQVELENGEESESKSNEEKIQPYAENPKKNEDSSEFVLPFFPTGTSATSSKDERTDKAQAGEENSVKTDDKASENGQEKGEKEAAKDKEKEEEKADGNKSEAGTGNTTETKADVKNTTKDADEKELKAEEPTSKIANETKTEDKKEILDKEEEKANNYKSENDDSNKKNETNVEVAKKQQNEEGKTNPDEMKETKEKAEKQKEEKKQQENDKGTQKDDDKVEKNKATKERKHDKKKINYHVYSGSVAKEAVDNTNISLKKLKDKNSSSEIKSVKNESSQGNEKLEKNKEKQKMSENITSSAQDNKDTASQSEKGDEKQKNQAQSEKEQENLKVKGKSESEQERQRNQEQSESEQEKQRNQAQSESDEEKQSNQAQSENEKEKQWNQAQSEREGEKQIDQSQSENEQEKESKQAQSEREEETQKNQAQSESEQVEQKNQAQSEKEEEKPGNQEKLEMEETKLKFEEQKQLEASNDSTQDQGFEKVGAQDDNYATMAGNFGNSSSTDESSETEKTENFQNEAQSDQKAFEMTPNEGKSNFTVDKEEWLSSMTDLDKNAMREDAGGVTAPGSDEQVSDVPTTSPTQVFMPGTGDSSSKDTSLLELKPSTESLSPIGSETPETAQTGEIEGVARSESKAKSDKDASSDDGKAVNIELTDSEEKELFGTISDHTDPVEVDISPTDKVSYFMTENNDIKRGEKRTIEPKQPLLHEDGNLILKRDKQLRYSSGGKPYADPTKKIKARTKSKKTTNKKYLKPRKRNFIEREKVAPDDARVRKRVLSLRSLFKRFLSSEK